MDARRSIPAVEKLLATEAFAQLAADEPRSLILDTLRDVLHEVRNGSAAPPEDPAVYADRTRAAINALRASTITTVINATGVVLHTNLGRAPLAEEAIAAMQRVAASYATLEYDSTTGRRGSRHTHCSRLLTRMTGAEDALLVNNNAAALVLALNTFARGRSVIVSRGELVEIGGSFRVPSIMARSGARMSEVGSTNRTHPADYTEAIDHRTAMLLKVHPSNFSIEGYASEVGLSQLVAIAKEHSLPVLYDLGSGLIDREAAPALTKEPSARDALRDGADIVTMSGDKLLGGPQAGIILGSAAHLAAMRRNPLYRALRVDKITIAALEATLLLHLDPAVARTRVPVLRMLNAGVEELEARAIRVVDALAECNCDATIVRGESSVGGGAAPGAALPTVMVRVTSGVTATRLEARLRRHERPVIARILHDAVHLDMRTVADRDVASLILTVQDSLRTAKNSKP